MEKNKKLRIVIDTNVLLVSVSTKSRYNWIYKGLVNGNYELYITNEILTEYEEIISSKYNSEVASDVIKMLLILPNVFKVDVYYKWSLIEDDADDNKFVDCFVAADADYIVTHDKHFDILKEIDFPNIEPIRIDEFQKMLLQNMWNKK